MGSQFATLIKLCKIESLFVWLKGILKVLNKTMWSGVYCMLTFKKNIYIFEGFLCDDV